MKSGGQISKREEWEASSMAAWDRKVELKSKEERMEKKTRKEKNNRERTEPEDERSQL